MSDSSGRKRSHTGYLPGEVVRGGKAGDVYLRIRRENLGYFRRTGRGRFEAEGEAADPQADQGRWVRQARDLLFGRPLRSEAIESERMSVFKALPILSSDALSSVAYGPEAALAVLAGAGAGALFWNVPIAIAVALLMIVVTISYQHVIRGYQGGGGSYAVAKANLGVIPGLVAAAALLVDYVLTVSVSVSSGVDAIVSAFNQLGPFRPGLSIALVAALLIGNLRGVREAGVLFALPTYLFIVAILVLVAAGLVKAALGGAPHPGRYAPLPVRESVTPLLVLAAFASGCSSMTGIEAVSNGVPGFKEPRVNNAIRTLAMLGALLVVLFVGVEVLDVLYAAEPHPGGNPTVLSEISAAVFSGPARPLYYVIQFATTLVLVLAANTSFNGLPRLCAILARDDFLPHRFAQLGNRLVYTSAITFLAVAATVLMLAFAGNTDALINLFALGVFTAFSLAQTAMARHWWRERSAGWQRGLLINGVGAAVTALVDVVIILTKSPRGAWVVVVLVPLLVLGMWAIHRHYARVRAAVAAAPVPSGLPRLGPCVVPVLRWNAAAADALAYAQSLSERVLVVPSTRTPIESLPSGMELRHPASGAGVAALMSEIDAVRHAAHGAVVTVVLPDVAEPFWLQLLMHPGIVRLKFALLMRRNVVAASFPGFAALFGNPSEGGPRHHIAFVPVASLDAVAATALAYAQSVADEVVAIHVAANVEEVGPEDEEELPAQFHRWAASFEEHPPGLVVIESPYRAIVPPLVSYVLRWRVAHPEPICTIVVPEVVDRRLTTLWLHNHRAFSLKAHMLREPGVGVADVTFHVGAGVGRISSPSAGIR